MSARAETLAQCDYKPCWRSARHVKIPLIMATREVTIVSAQVPNATRAELERRAEAGYRSISAEIRIAIDEHLRKQKEQ